MKKEFNLSDYIILMGESKLGKFPSDMLEAGRVKEAVKILKEELSNSTRMETTNQIIQEIFGDKLT